MSIYEFMMLNDTEKGEATLGGIFIGHRRIGNEARTLYCLGNFFVELVYTSDHQEFKGFRQFTKTYLLEPYLDQFPHIE
ncbi:hypothetical protein GCM10023231_18390 [Olivibacter ginsenosidimutans]|uniref:Uncharacterized protein n=1 Tax=Olivibacter ginsenosidimutans TaxID=1176537 RepID=A0ABP9B7W3_9SPHI